MQNQNKRLFERIIGLSFIMATLFYGIGNSMLLENTKIGVLLELQNSLMVIVIGVFMYKLIDNVDPKVRAVYLATRIVEAILLAIGAIYLLNANDSTIEMLLKQHDKYFTMGMLVLGLYSAFYFAHLAHNKIGPKYLMLLGSVGYVALTIYSAMSLIIVGSEVSMLWFIPGAVFEVVFPLWLILKGFQSSEIVNN